MTWRIEGHAAASRRYANKREFIDEALAPTGKGQAEAAAAYQGADQGNHGLDRHMS